MLLHVGFLLVFAFAFNPFVASTCVTTVLLISSRQTLRISNKLPSSNLFIFFLQKKDQLGKVIPHRKLLLQALLLSSTHGFPDNLFHIMFMSSSHCFVQTACALEIVAALDLFCECLSSYTCKLHAITLI